MRVLEVGAAGGVAGPVGDRTASNHVVPPTGDLGDSDSEEEEGECVCVFLP